PAPKLVRDRCPKCRSPELFPVSRVGQTVSCRRKDDARFQLSKTEPFVADDWDECEFPGPLRQCLEFHKIEPPPRANAAFAVALARAIYPKSRSVWLRKAVAFGEKVLATGTAPFEEMAEIPDGLVDGQPPWARPPWAQLGVCCLSGDP